MSYDEEEKRENVGKRGNKGNPGGGYASSNSGSGNYRGNRSNNSRSRRVPGNKHSNSGSGGANGAMLWLAVAMVGLPLSVVATVVSYLVVKS